MVRQNSRKPSHPRAPESRARPTRVLATVAIGLAMTAGEGTAGAASATITVDASKVASGLPHFWSNCVGTGTASLTLRTDLQSQYQLANRELGMQRVRGHGVLNDLNLFQWTGGSATPTYNWANLDTYLQAIVAANMRPLIELSFNPTSLGTSGTNSPPSDYTVYQQYIHDFVQHLVDEMGTIDGGGATAGAADVGKWYFEVWNEPNYPGFWSGTFDDYLTLYSHAVAGATAVLPDILIGGPVTTSGSSAQIQQFLSYVKTNNLRATFVSSHDYASGGDGNMADPTFAVSDNNARVMLMNASGLPNLVSVNSEWSSSYSGQGNNMADTCVSMDNNWNAPFIVKTVKLVADTTQGNTPPLEIFSYWAISDIFNEGVWIPNDNNVPFAEIFGLMNFQGIRKAAWNGFKMLSYLGSQRLTATGGSGNSDGVDAFAAESANGDEVEVIVYSFYGASENLSAATGTDTATLTVNNLPFTGPAYVTQFPVDAGHANPYGVWTSQGKPVTPTEAQWEAMRAQQHLIPAQAPTQMTLNGSYTGMLTIPQQGAVLVTIGKSRPVTGRNAFVTMEGEDFDGQSGATKEDSNDTSMGQAVLGNSGSYIFFDDTDFSDAGVDSVQLRVNAAAATTLTLTADSQTGTMLGKCSIPAATAYATVTCPLTTTTGVHTLYVSFGGTVHLNWLAFTGPENDGGAPTGTTTGTTSGAGATSGAGPTNGTGATSGTGATTGTTSGTGTGGTATGSSSGTEAGSNSSGSSGSGATPGSSNSGGGCSVISGKGVGGSLALAGIGLAALRLRRRRTARDSR